MDVDICIYIFGQALQTLNKFRAQKNKKNGGGTF
jgi:hypothetical protein